jgi:hypothetical protein
MSGDSSPISPLHPAHASFLRCPAQRVVNPTSTHITTSSPPQLVLSTCVPQLLPSSACHNDQQHPTASITHTRVSIRLHRAKPQHRPVAPPAQATALSSALVPGPHATARDAIGLCHRVLHASRGRLFALPSARHVAPVQTRQTRARLPPLLVDPPPLCLLHLSHAQS